MQVGDYVRTECGIAKIKNFETKNKEIIELDKDIMICNMDCYRNNCTIRQIIKSNPNIIVLIEVGDYVNGHRVYEVKENCVLVGYKCFKTEFDNEEDFLYQTIYEKDIKSITTKEQFESVQYEVK